MEKIKLFLISYLSIIFVLSIFLVLNVFSFFIEHFLGKIDIETAWKVRLLSIGFELLVVGTGFLMKAQIWLRKRRFLNNVLDSFKVESLVWRYRLIDIIAVFVCIYLAYVGRLLYFFFDGSITFQSLILGSVLGLIGVFLFGYVKRVVRYGKQKIHKYHNNRKWSSACIYQAGLFLFF